MNQVDVDLIREAYSKVMGYPKDVQPTWHGIIGDTNAPDTDHWYYDLAENNHPLNWTFLKQPGGVIGTVTGDNPATRTTTWLPNPYAENINNLPDGYYINQIQGKKDDWIRVNLANEYGAVSSGKPIYQGVWNDAVHVSEHKLLPIPLIKKLLIGFDFGRTPAAIIGQLMPNGKLRVLRELIATSMGIRSFMDQSVLPCLKSDFPTFDIEEMEAYGDPSGIAKSGNDENSPIGILNDEYNLTTYPTATNIPLRRWESVNDFLMNTIDGVQAFELSNCCSTLRKGFNGGYHFRRLNVSGEKYAEAADKNKFSHCFVFDTAIDTKAGIKKIGDVKVGDLVETPFGLKPVLATMNSVVTELIELTLSDGRVIVCTPNHPFYTVDGIRRADALQYLSLVSKADKVSVEWVDQVNIKYKNLTALSSTKRERDISKLVTEPMEKLSTCTVMFGSFTMARLRMGFKFTMLTMINRITELKILRLCHILNTPVTTADLQQEPSKQGSTWRALDRWLLNGIDQKKVESGTATTQSAQQQKGKLLSINACGVKKNIKQKLAQLKKAFAVCRVKVWQGKHQALTMLNESVAFVAESSRQTNTQNEKHAARVVTARLLPQKDTVRVYDLMVQDAECFYANGILVHNCHDALQYLAQGAQGEINYAWLDQHLANSDSNQSVIADTTSGY